MVIDLVEQHRRPSPIHWHGIELESYNDGVPDGAASRQRSRRPWNRATFDVNFTPPRAGTFMYHTHGHDSLQLAAGCTAR